MSVCQSASSFDPSLRDIGPSRCLPEQKDGPVFTGVLAFKDGVPSNSPMISGECLFIVTSNSTTSSSKARMRYVLLSFLQCQHLLTLEKISDILLGKTKLTDWFLQASL